MGSVREKLSVLVKHAVIGTGQNADIYECQQCGESLHTEHTECPECGSTAMAEYSFL